MINLRKFVIFAKVLLHRGGEAYIVGGDGMKWIGRFLLAALVGIVLFWAFASDFIERKVEGIAGNEVIAEPWPGCGQPGEPADACADLAGELVIDLHADSFMWNRDLNRRVAHGHTDFPRFADGRVDIQIIGAPTKTPYYTEYESDLKETTICIDRDSIDLNALVALATEFGRFDLVFSPKGRALRQAERFHDWIGASVAPKVHPIFDRESLGLDHEGRLTRPEGEPALMLSIEGMHWIDAESDVAAEIETLERAGYRMLALTHRFTNDLAFGSEDCALARDGVADGGLKPAGRAALAEMFERGLIVDLAHASEQTIVDVTDAILDWQTANPEKPVGLFMSHGGVARTCPGPRNLTDKAIRHIVRAGGVIGVGFWTEAVCFAWGQNLPRPLRDRAMLDSIAAGYFAIMHAVESADPAFWGEAGAPDPLNHLALGSDFDGAVVTPGDTSAVPARLAAYLANITCDQALLDRLRMTRPDRQTGLLMPGDDDTLAAKCEDYAGRIAAAPYRILGGNAARVLAQSLRAEYRQPE